MYRATVIWLSDFGEHFSGGRTLFWSASAGGPGLNASQETQETIEPRAGRAVLFSSGWENPHGVEPLVRTSYCLFVLPLLSSLLLTNCTSIAGAYVGIDLGSKEIWNAPVTVTFFHYGTTYGRSNGTSIAKSNRFERKW
eukprot:SAG31_NODE_2094_length_6458_cov_7.319547_7_plen_139_part_00